MESVQTFFSSHRDSILRSIHNLGSLKSWADRHITEIDRNPAAWCAIELALLDLLAREKSYSVEQLLSLPVLHGEFTYTAVLGDNKLKHFASQVDQYITMGFGDYKVKLCGELDRDREKLQYLVARAPDSRLRLDANNLWQEAGQVIAYINALGIAVYALEEPLAVDDFAGLTQLAQSLDVKIILDESFTRLDQFSRLADTPSLWIINIRVSKMGGLLRSLEIALKARQSGVGCIIGAQVGETSLLTRAALTLANACHDNLVAQEGAYGTFLLERDICDPPLMFAAGGTISAPQLDRLGRDGFGLQISLPFPPEGMSFISKDDR